MTCGVYTIRSKTTGNCYVGQSQNIGKRWKDHRRLLDTGKHHNPHLQRAWHKYGSEDFKWSVLRTCEVSELTKYEQEAADSLRVACIILYNVGDYTDSPRRGRKHSDDTRQKMSLRVGIKHHSFGVKFSAEHCERISQSLSGNKNPRYGRPSHRRLLTEVQVKEILIAYFDGASQRDLGKAYNVQWTTIGRITRGEYWKEAERPIGPRYRGAWKSRKSKKVKEETV